MKKKSHTSRRPRETQSTGGASADDRLVRLQKVLAAHGCGSRRACEEFILDGRVEVDGKVVTKLGTKVDPARQKVTVDGERLVEQQLQYFVLNKPPGVVSTARDPSGRLRVIDLIKTDRRVYNVGRLDKSSEGLILVTNDGDLANKLTHPRYGVEKKYHVLVKGRPNREDLATLQQGMYLAEAKVRVQHVRVRKNLKDRTWLEIVLDEGRNREIRRILAKIGHKVLQLRRVSIGPLHLGDLPLGTHRQLSPQEVKRLKQTTSRVVSSPRSSKKKKARSGSTSAGRSGANRHDRARVRSTKKKSKGRNPSSPNSGRRRPVKSKSRRTRR